MPRLRTIASLLCLLAYLGTAALWARRGTRADVVAFCSPAGHWQAAGSTEGGLALFVSAIPAGSDWAGTVRTLHIPRDDFADAYAAVFDPVNVRNSVAGFKLARGTFAIGSKTPGYDALLVPHWAVVVPLAVPPLLWVRGRVRRRRWAREGRCRHCGYDLRDSPERCPECGAEPANGKPAELSADVAASGITPRWGRRAGIAVLVIAATALTALAVRPVAWRASRGPLAEGDQTHVVRLHDVTDPARAMYDRPDDPAVRRYETAAEDPGSQENLEKSNLCFFDGPYTGTYPRVVDEWPERLQGFGDAVLFATDAADPDADYVSVLPASDQAILVAPPATQAKFVQMLQFLRDPASSGLTLIEAGERAAPASREIQDVEAKLAEVLPEVRFEGVTIEAAFEQLAEEAKANLLVDWPALAREGLERDTPVKLHLWDLPLSRVIAVLLASAADRGGGDGAGRAEVGVRAEKGVIRITSRAVLAKSGVVTRVYDVRNVAERILADSPPPATARATTRPEEEEDQGRTWYEVIEEISSFITERVDPDSWNVNGGEVGDIRELGGRLFIRQTPEGHRQVEDALKLLADEFGKD